MLVPFIVFLMILSPVLIPATVTAVAAIRQRSRPARIARRQRRLASRRLAVPAAA